MLNLQGKNYSLAIASGRYIFDISACLIRGKRVRTVYTKVPPLRYPHIKKPVYTTASITCPKQYGFSFSIYTKGWYNNGFTLYLGHFGTISIRKPTINSGISRFK